MKTIESVRQGKVKKTIKMVLVGSPGSGKTHLAATFPKTLFIITCPNEEDTFLMKPDLHKNIVGWEHFIPDTEKNVKQVLADLEKFIVEEVRPRVKSGEVETVVLDNITFLAEYYWKYICEFERNLHLTKSGEFNTQAAYGTLKDKLRDSILTNLVSLNANVIINVHLRLETEEAMEKQVDKTTPYNMAIAGSFRNQLSGMVSYVFYLDRKQEPVEGKRVMRHFIRTTKSGGFPAKSRLQLPEIIYDVNYDKLKNTIDAVFNGKA